MTTSHRRFALLTGASLATLGVASIIAPSAALAAPHDTLADGTYAGTTTAGSPITICDIAGTNPCFTGVIDTTPPSAAVVNTGATGRIIQANGGATLTQTMTNAAGSSAEVGAIAIGGLSPVATVYRGVFQSGTGGDVTNNFDNEGTLLVDAVASGTGVAAASINDGGIAQWAHGAGANANNFTNGGTLNIDATAVGAGASATVDFGIWQDATGTSASNTLTNGGTLNIAANATATSGTAVASVDNGITQ